MSIVAWSKKSSGNTWAILLVLLGIGFLNAYYKDRPDSKTETLAATSGDIALASASPKVKAFLKMIRWAEGTAGENGYRMMFTGVIHKGDFSEHPRIINCIKLENAEDLCSDVFGAYQFLSPTWDEKAKKLGLTDVSPKNQDIAAIDLLNDVNAIRLIEKDDIEGAIIKASIKWASLPKAGGGSVYVNQKARPMKALLQIYREALLEKK
jgi:lysozyme